MKPWEVARLFKLHNELLLIYEPQEAMLWFTREQPLCANQRPCELIETPDGLAKVERAIRHLTDGAFT